MERRSGFQFDVVAALGYPLWSDGLRHDLALHTDPASNRHSAERSATPMSVFGIGVSYGLAPLFAMFWGMPIAFALGAVVIVFMGIYMPAASLAPVTQNVYEEVAPSTLIPRPRS